MKQETTKKAAWENTSNHLKNKHNETNDTKRRWYVLPQRNL